MDQFNLPEKIEKRHTTKTPKPKKTSFDELVHQNSGLHLKKRMSKEQVKEMYRKEEIDKEGSDFDEELIMDEKHESFFGVKELDSDDEPLGVLGVPFADEIEIIDEEGRTLFKEEEDLSDNEEIRVHENTKEEEKK